MPVAEFQRVAKRYVEVEALRGIDLSIGRGELAALLGPNGAGKTTAVRILPGLAAPTSGEASIFGRHPASYDAKLRRGALLQVAKVSETRKVREHIELFSSYYRKPLPIAETIAAAGLGSVQNRLFGDLSGGQKQRVLFALALCGNPDLLFLDEPTVGLDVESRRALWAHIRGFVGRGSSVLLTDIDAGVSGYRRTLRPPRSPTPSARSAPVRGSFFQKAPCATICRRPSASRKPPTAPRRRGSPGKKAG